MRPVFFALFACTRQTKPDPLDNLAASGGDGVQVWMLRKGPSADWTLPDLPLVPHQQLERHAEVGRPERWILKREDSTAMHGPWPSSDSHDCYAARAALGSPNS